MPKIRRIAEALRALGYYILYVGWVVFRLSWQTAMQLAAWLNDEERKTLRVVLAIAVLAAVALVFRVEVEWFARYGWDHDRSLLLRSIIVGVKLVSALAIAIGLLSAGLGIVLALLAVPLVALWNLIVALARGLGVAVRAWRTPTVAAIPPDAAPADSEIVLVQVSDLHLAAPGREPFELEVEPGHWDEAVRPTSERLRDRVQRILTAARAQTPGCPIVVTGDITDTGEDVEWAQAVEALTPFAPQVMLVPGNHDLSINRTPAPDIRGAHRRGRRQRFVAAAARLGDDGADAWLRRFSLGTRATLFAVDTNRYPSRYVLSNAVGLCGRAQLAALAEALASTTGPIVVAAHHHPARHDNERSSAEELFMLAIDGGGLLALLVDYQRRAPGNAVLVLHGHRHLSLYGRHREVVIYGHPSSTLGHATAAGLDRTARYAAIHLTADGRWVVVAHAVETALPA